MSKIESERKLEKIHIWKKRKAKKRKIAVADADRN
jgi:hypothetical protein